MPALRGSAFFLFAFGFGGLFLFAFGFGGLFLFAFGFGFLLFGCWLFLGLFGLFLCALRLLRFFDAFSQFPAFFGAGFAVDQFLQFGVA